MTLSLLNGQIECLGDDIANVVVKSEEGTYVPLLLAIKDTTTSTMSSPKHFCSSYL